MKKRKLIITISAVAVIVLATVIAAVLILGQEKTPDFGEPVAEHQWKLHSGWVVYKNNSGKESVVAESPGTTVSWNTEYSMSTNWSVSTNIGLVCSTDGRDCARLVFGDALNNVCLAVSVEYSGKGYVQVLADALLNRGGRLEKDGWRNVFATEEWIQIDPEKALNLSVSHAEGDQLLLITLSQDGKILLQEFSDDVHQDLLNALVSTGLGVYDSFVEFSEFTVEDVE